MSWALQVQVRLIVYKNTKMASVSRCFQTDFMQWQEVRANGERQRLDNYGCLIVQ